MYIFLKEYLCENMLNSFVENELVLLKRREGRRYKWQFKNFMKFFQFRILCFSYVPLLAYKSLTQLQKLKISRFLQILFLVLVPVFNYNFFNVFHYASCVIGFASNWHILTDET